MIQIYIIFHKQIFDECYKEIPQEILNKYFTFIAANENITKIYDNTKYKVINEWDLPIYDPTLQERYYRENSVLRHIFLNNMHNKYKYIGFMQYDMIISKDIINILNFIENSTEDNFYFANCLTNFAGAMINTWNEINTMQFIFDDYKKYFDMTDLNYEVPYPLLNTYIISSKIFNKIMPWTILLDNKIIPWCIQPPNKTHNGHIAGIFERVMAIAIAGQNLKPFYWKLNHEQEIKAKAY